MVSGVAPGRGRLTLVEWLVILVAVIGFAFDTYELLMLPLIAGPALAEVLQVPPNNPLVTEWVGNMLWITALCGGIFGLLGGWLTDRFGRKKVLAASIDMWRSDRPGYSTPAAWENMQKALLDTKLLAAPVDLGQAYTNAFVP